MIETNYQYWIDYTPEGEYSCSERGCDDEGICRCYRIISVEIESVDLMAITNTIYDRMFPKGSIQTKRDNQINIILNGYDQATADKYCIYRILVTNRVFDAGSWEPTWEHNYYGEEVSSIDLIPYRKVNEEIEKVVSMENLSDKIKFVLTLEYGRVLERLQDLDFTIVMANRDDIVLGQTNHQTTVGLKNLDFYSDRKYDLPRGVAYSDGTKWRIVDGYHRISQTKLEKIPIIGAKQKI